MKWRTADREPFFQWHIAKCRRCGTHLAADSHEGLEMLKRMHDNFSANRIEAVNSMNVPFFRDMSFFEYMDIVAN